ncbi:MAG: hypothetical protein IKO65_01805 [Victivallales bacterium]|nr:hypothetical protein [Victivallales bacterium]
MKKFTPKDTLEELVKKGDNREIIGAVLDGEMLSRPDVFLTHEFQSLWIETARMLALMALPKSLRREALELALWKAGENSEIYVFLKVNFENSENKPRPDNEELRLHKLIEEEDIEQLENFLDEDDAKTRSFPLELLPHLAKLPVELQRKLLREGLDSFAQVMLCSALCEDDDTAASEVMKLSYDEKCGLVNLLIPILMRDDSSDQFEGDDDSSEDFDADGDEANEEGPRRLSFFSPEKLHGHAVSLICEYFEQNDVEYDYDEEKEIFHVFWPLSEGSEEIEAVVLAGAARFILVLAYFPGDKCPSTYLSALAELLMFANQQIPLGGFELDYTTGKVIFKQCIYIGAFVGDAETALGFLTGGMVTSFQDFGSSITAVMRGEKTAKEAIAEWDNNHKNA